MRHLGLLVNPYQLQHGPYVGVINLVGLLGDKVDVVIIFLLVSAIEDKRIKSCVATIKLSIVKNLARVCLAHRPHL